MNTRPDDLKLADVMQVIDQIDQPQKIVVPKFVAEWIETCKHSEWSLRNSMESTAVHSKLDEWFLKREQNTHIYPNQETFALAWIYGYEVEKKPLYVVTDGNKLYLKEFDELNAVIIIDDVVGAIDHVKRYSDKTAAQKAADELGWVVKEVVK
ncbi:DUF1642 domain-containing protein [Streptococcus suis]|uniref:DUF1642 domain-containing protein n=1 Tax=Streptococcus suis TaxID=1307 RepID=UPI003F8912A8